MLRREARPERSALVEVRKQRAGYLRGFEMARATRKSLLESGAEHTLLAQLDRLGAPGGERLVEAAPPSGAGSLQYGGLDGLRPESPAPPAG